MKSKIISSLIKAVMISLLLVLSGCVTNPVTGKKQVSLMSEQQEIALGADSDPQIISQFGLYQDSALQHFIDTFGQLMAGISHRPGLKYQFRVLDSPVVNAFAVPGGYVYFTRGILAHFNNEAAFAGVLGHEIGHITARHSIEQQTNSILGQVLLVGGMIVSKEVRAFSREAQEAMQLLFLQYSRDNESQSDRLGVEYATRIGFDTKEMAYFFKTLDALSHSGEEGEEEIPSFLSTHPNPLDRFEKVQSLTTEWQSKINLPSYKVNRESYLRMIDGLVYGEDPRQGYVDGGNFYHPELKFQFPIPNGWELINTPTQVQIMDPNGKAMMMLTLAEGEDPAAAAKQAVSQYELTVKSSKEVNVNGLKGVEVISEQVSQDPNSGQSLTLRIKSLFVQFNKLVYVFHGLANATEFGTYDPAFHKTMYGFKEVKDQSKLKVNPERIKVVTVKTGGTLSQALNEYNQSNSRHKELGILNGLEVTDRVEAGTLIKIFSTEPR